MSQNLRYITVYYILIEKYLFPVLQLPFWNIWWDWRWEICHCVAPSHSGKVAKAFLLNLSGWDMAAKRSVWIDLPPILPSHAYNIITLGLTTPRIGVLEQVWWEGAHYFTETRYQCRYHNFLSAVPFDRQIVWYNLTDFITIHWQMNIERLAFSSNRLHRIPWLDLNVVFDPLLLPSTNTNQLSRRRSLFGISLRVFW